MIAVFFVTLPIFLIILAGFIFKKVNLAQDSWTEALNGFVLNAAFPAVIINSLTIPGALSVVSPSVILANIFLLNALLFSIYFLLRFLRVDKSTAAAVSICAWYGNTAYLGMPFVTSLIPGSAGAVSVHIAIYLVVLFTSGLFILEHASGKPISPIPLMKSLLNNPMSIAILLGLVVQFAGLEVPRVFRKTMDMLGASSSPAILFGLGIFMARGFAVDNTLVKASLLSIVKIAIVPFLFVLIDRFAGLGDGFRVSTLEAAMPIGLSAFAFTGRYPIDKRVIATAVIVSTLVSVVSLPLFASLIK